MRFRLTNIITKTGDKGTTRIGDGSQISKASPRIMAIGGIDELNTCIGVLRLYVTEAAILEKLINIQHQLLVAGSQLAGSKKSALQVRHLEFLEQWAAELMVELEPLQDFVLPGGGHAGAYCHMVRVTCRRTERYVVAAQLDDELAALPIQYLNRLSDVLFVLARVLNAQQDVNEIVLNRDI